MYYFTEPDRYIRDKVKVVLDFSNYTSKKELANAHGVGMSNLVAKSDFTALKAEFDKLDIKRLINVPASFNNFKTKVDDLDVDKLKIVPTDLKKLHD